MIFDKAARILYESQDKCYACKEEFIIVILVIERSFHIIVISHRCHFTGKYRGALHPRCNLSLRKSNTTPVFANNLTGYDSHLFITRLLIQKVM